VTSPDPLRPRGHELDYQGKPRPTPPTPMYVAPYRKVLCLVLCVAGAVVGVMALVQPTKSARANLLTAAFVLAVFGLLVRVRNISF
jgi:hypothetical protein